MYINFVYQIDLVNLINVFCGNTDFTCSQPTSDEGREKASWSAEVIVSGNFIVTVILVR